jgi:hypothetical protein
VVAAYREAGANHDSRIAMPESMRRGVPSLLSLGSHPVLFDPETVSAQGLAAQGVTHVLTPDPATRAALGGPIADSTSIGGFELLTLDRQAALHQRLPPGRSIVWLESRPYRYRPLSDAALLEPETPMVFAAVLDPGRYEFRFDAFAPNKGRVKVRVNLPKAKRKRFVLGRVAYHPFSYSFEVPGDEPKRVKVTLRATIDDGKYARFGYVNRAELYRQP